MLWRDGFARSQDVKNCFIAALLQEEKKNLIFVAADCLALESSTSNPRQQFFSIHHAKKFL